MKRPWLFIILLSGLVCALPGHARADGSIKQFLRRLFHLERPSAEQSALAPLIPTQPSLSQLLINLKSRFPEKRIAAIEGLARVGETGTPAIAALVRAAQDPNPEVSRRGMFALSQLCQRGHSTEVIRAYSRALKNRPHEVHVLYTGYYFKVTRPADEHRAEQQFASAPEEESDRGALPETDSP